MEHDEVAQHIEDTTLSAAEFKELYGFEHNCHCLQDWHDTNLELVSKCYTELCDDALTTCHRFKGLVADLERRNTMLRVQIEALGVDPIG